MQSVLPLMQAEAYCLCVRCVVVVKLSILVLIKLFPHFCHVKVSGCCSMYYLIESRQELEYKFRIHKWSTLKVLYTSFMYGV